MSEQLIFSASYGIALADESVPCVTTQWYGFANQAEFIALQGAALQYFEQHSTPAQPWCWIGDVRQMGAIPAEAQRWLQQEFNPKAIAAGLREVRVVVADGVLGQIATQHYAQQTEHSSAAAELRVTYYPSVEAAKAGIRTA